MQATRNSATDAPLPKALSWTMRAQNLWIDLGIIRKCYANQAEIVPGVYRSNQPDLRRLSLLRDKGVKTVLLLRGVQATAPFLAVQYNCATLGLKLVTFPMSARRLPRPEKVLELITLLRGLEKPFLMHCRAGADRTGLASAIYLLTVENAPVAEAQQMLSRKFGHYAFTKTGVLDHFLRYFAQAHEASGISFEDWIKSGYNPEEITRDFKEKRGFLGLGLMRG